MATSAPHPALENLTVDPEDDLDDLDDVLSQFNPGASSQVPASPPPPPPPSAATTTTFGRPRTNTRVDAPPQSIAGSGRNLGVTDEGDEDEFAKELAQGMESLMREIAGEAGVPEASASGNDTSESERSRAFKAAWEAMLVEGMDGNIGEDGIAGLGGEAFEKGAVPAKDGTGGFQDKIKQAMNKMKENEAKIQGSGAPPGGAPSAESLDAILQSLGDLGLGEGGDEDAELAGFLETMMGQLMSKEVLYEPLKELADGFPTYLEKPPAPLSTEDRTRYENQFACVKKVIAIFEASTYDDANAECSKQVVDLMGEMQSYGTPPTELMGVLPPGLEGAGLGLGDKDCTIA
ncbi:hypothetical protein HYPSUDRAFT_45460 [Hypholoma sublateritium FD-334 SS-4]|uniref:Pex19-domain-containing protein n=1 Tax=Hypholoma sublateritium (strain FD-334 SS-4) TaxID=945553 RepID=A0A0D2KUG7_HYPSF|nr:hypothetical protein HYPSUDRAFT_45460 [Hypholoma sublateritium FD-334 SS-4]